MIFHLGAAIGDAGRLGRSRVESKFFENSKSKFSTLEGEIVNNLVRANRESTSILTSTLYRYVAAEDRQKDRNK